MSENPSIATHPPTESLNSRQLVFRAQMGVIAGLFLCLYGSILASLVREWWTQEGSSHGFLVPPICLIILWANRIKLRSLPIKPACKAGFVVMVAAAVVLILSNLGGVLSASQFSLLIMLSGLIVTLFGVRFLSALRFPVLYLVFMLPSLTGAVLTWNWQFQLITARMAVFLMQLLGIPAQLDENHIILPNVILRVASSCSGARYLITILALALPLAHVVLRRHWSRIALVVLALTIAVGANWSRVVLIGLWAYSGGKVVHGPFHVFQALSVAWVAFSGLIFATWALSRIESKGGRHVVQTAECSQLGAGPEHTHSRSWNHAWMLAVMFLLGLILILSLYPRGPVPLKQSFANFPSVVGQWVRSEANNKGPILRVAGADEELYRVYAGAGNQQQLHLYVAYFEHQQQDKEAVNYLMAPIHEDAQTVVLGDAQSGTRVGWNFVVDDPQLNEILFWYDTNGRITSSALKAKVYTIWDALVRARTNGALVMVYREREQNSSEESDPELKEFVRHLLPVLREYLP